MGFSSEKRAERVHAGEWRGSGRGRKGAFSVVTNTATVHQAHRLSSPRLDPRPCRKYNVPAWNELEDARRRWQASSRLRHRWPPGERTDGWTTSRLLHATCSTTCRTRVTWKGRSCRGRRLPRWLRTRRTHVTVCRRVDCERSPAATAPTSAVPSAHSPLGSIARPVVVEGCTSGELRVPDALFTPPPSSFHLRFILPDSQAPSSTTTCRHSPAPCIRAPSKRRHLCS